MSENQKSETEATSEQKPQWNIIIRDMIILLAVMEFVDEFLTTTTAQKKLHAAGKKAKHFKPVIDQAAAVEILNNRMRAHGEFDNEFALPPEDFPPV